MRARANDHRRQVSSPAFTPDSQPSDLLQEALRSGGGSNLDDYVDAKLYVSSTEDSQRWHQLLGDYLHDQTPRAYIWQRDPPQVDVLDASRVSSPYLVYGIHLRYGDALHDEWLLISLLVSLTRKYSEVACEVSDVDGDPLLIEAAPALPKWLSPENAGHRVWIHQGMLHICPKAPSEQPPDIKPLAVEAAVDMVLDDDCETIASPSVQRCIITKLKSKPWSIDLMHVRLLLPAVLAEQLIRQPQIISLLLDYLPPDRLAERGSSVITESISRGELVTIQVSMTKLHYASLMGVKGRLRMPARLAFGGQQMRSRSEENTVMLGRLVSLAAHCAVKANNKDTAHFEKGKGLLDRMEECREEEAPLERFAKYDGPSDSDAWLIEAIEEAGKKEDGLTEEEQKELQDVSTRLNDLMGKASGIFGIESHEEGSEGSDDDMIDDMPDSDAEEEEVVPDVEMKRYMKQLDEELRMSMGADDHHVDAMDDEAVDREDAKCACLSGAPSNSSSTYSTSPLRPLVTSSTSPQRSSERLRSQLLSVGETFIGFDKVIEDEAAKRRSSEEHRVTDLADTVTRLDKALSDEVRRRSESTNTLTRVTEQMANDMLDRLQNGILGRLEEVAKTVETLALREEGFRGELPSKLLVDASALQREIRELGEKMKGKRQVWADKDHRLLERSEEIGLGLERKVDNECTTFEKQTSGLDKEVEALRKLTADSGAPDRRVTEEDQFRGFLLEELASIKKDILVRNADAIQSQSIHDVVEHLQVMN
ncbi:SF-assemblin, putative [Perkinsus marinus ATCC 50983]|uniref:SF-assemblin, putative n=1 Tax=Perkinsus marinus (strain ATCC 50983 / TXsc) TaxID=423536 RepID=C5K6S0_PERM5|nr:SF-assemblin, putative [Perkinsus marinus ATCC 50983]EER19990.1 SF-assemblin, putative [Perkinsus marinus ATCC 50983]|eukprot:XP_002788194.1 SF-assemblin, putative [Perkinsus marinus ATCC 50983]